MFWNISSGVKWGASFVPTWVITLSGFYFSRGTAKNFMYFMVAPGKVPTLIIFILDILYSHKPDKIESPIIKVVPFFQVCCLLAILGSDKSLKVVTGSSFSDVANNSLCLDCKDFVFSIKIISWLIALSATLSKGGLSVWSEFISDPDLISAWVLSLCALLILKTIVWDKSS